MVARCFCLQRGQHHSRSFGDCDHRHSTAVDSRQERISQAYTSTTEFSVDLAGISEQARIIVAHGNYFFVVSAYSTAGQWDPSRTDSIHVQ